jgi:protein involved in sex pheromone biosynthesis
MKKSIALLFAASTLLFAGCSTTHHHTAKWEYKTVEAREGEQDAIISKLTGDGWRVVSFSATEGQPNVIHYHYVLKRSQD